MEWGGRLVLPKRCPLSPNGVFFGFWSWIPASPARPKGEAVVILAGLARVTEKGLPRVQDPSVSRLGPGDWRQGKGRNTIGKTERKPSRLLLVYTARLLVGPTESPAPVRRTVAPKGFLPVSWRVGPESSPRFSAPSVADFPESLEYATSR